ncbi:hypothetical protein ABEB36_006603 [Hypothenemus hampei]|uniref:Dehydrogenase/reductase SDR family member 11 n=1 Tax=Hypothenemus hampei TaxID=57062 RepID=A0ABD1ER40_HYPHA
MDVSSINQYIGKLAVITGASAGIGAALTTNLARRGINVVGLARRIEKVQELAKENTKGKIYAIKCDITNEQDVIRAFQEIEKLGPIHILINNAGKIANTTLYNGNVDEWKKVLDVNVIGTCLLSREVVRTMTENNVAGQIININSILGHFKYDTPLNIYPASKFALTSLTETLRLELIGIDSKIKLTVLKIIYNNIFRCILSNIFRV